LSLLNLKIVGCKKLRFNFTIFGASSAASEEGDDEDDAADDDEDDGRVQIGAA
jgi:hypothetical protein